MCLVGATAGEWRPHVSKRTLWPREGAGTPLSSFVSHCLLSVARDTFPTHTRWLKTASCQKCNHQQMHTCLFPRIVYQAGESKDSDDSSGQVSRRGPTACRSRHINIRRRSAGSSATPPAPAARSRCKRRRSPCEDDRGSDTHEGEATRTAPGSTDDSNGDPRVRVVHGAANHTGSSSSREDAASHNRAAKLEDPSVKAQTTS